MKKNKEILNKLEVLEKRIADLEDNQSQPKKIDIKVNAESIRKATDRNSINISKK